MPQQGITFQGGFLALPGAYYADNVSAVGQDQVPNTPPLIFIGYGYGPKPFTPATYYNAQNLINALRGGPAAAYVPFLAYPSPQYGGAQQITFIDVSTNTQSTLAVLNSGAAACLNLTSVLYGPPSNLLQASVTAGTTTGVAITLTDKYAGTQISGNNLGYPMEVAYLGSGTTGISLTVAASAVLATGPNPGETTLIPIGASGYSTVAQVVQALNGTSAFGAEVLSSTQGLLPASGLTSGTYALTATGSTAVYVPIPAYLNDAAFWVNNFASSYATAVASGTDVVGNLPVAAPAKYFTGATGVPPTTSSYASGFNQALSLPGFVVFADSNTAAVRALGAQHAMTASTTPYGMWRRFFTGSTLGDSVATTITNANALGTVKEAVYVYPGIVQTSTLTGLPTTYGGLYAAAMAAGIAIGAPINTPLTNKQLNGIGVEVVLNTTNLANLQNNGVMAVFQPTPGPGLPTILSDMTTWEADNNVENTSTQQVACRQWLAYTTINALQPWVGSIAAPVNEALILAALVKAYNGLIYTGGSNPGVLASWDQSSLRLVYTGANQLASITANVVLVGQNRYITVYNSVLPLNITITATANPTT